MELYKKLLNIRKSISYIKKDSTCTAMNYTYVSSSQALGAIRQKMDEEEVLLVPEITESKVDKIEGGRGIRYFTTLSISFTWINVNIPKEKIEIDWVGHGIDNSEKGIGKALTYAEKYFILKFFQVPTDDLDPDQFTKKVESQNMITKELIDEIYITGEGLGQDTSTVQKGANYYYHKSVEGLTLTEGKDLLIKIKSKDK